MKYLLIISVIFIMGCSCTVRSGPSTSTSGHSTDRYVRDTDGHKLKCKQIGPRSIYILRCENNEVVCYRNGESMQCKFKKSEFGSS